MCRQGEYPTSGFGLSRTHGGSKGRFFRHGGLFVRCGVLLVVERTARESALARCHIGSNEPTRLSLGRVASLQSPLPFHLVSFFRLQSGTISFRRQAVVSVLLEDEPLLSGLGDG